MYGNKKLFFFFFFFFCSYIDFKCINVGKYVFDVYLAIDFRLENPKHISRKMSGRDFFSRFIVLRVVRLTGDKKLFNDDKKLSCVHISTISIQHLPSRDLTTLIFYGDKKLQK